MKKRVNAIYASMNEEQTQILAKLFSKTLRKGDIVLLEGDLGAGKTFFVRAVINALNPKITVNSPTFTLENQYKTKLGRVRHLDLYRIEDVEELSQFYEPGDITFIEWPDKANIKGTINIKIIKAGDNERKFQISY